MSYFWTAFISFAVGAVLCRLYFNKVIALGHDLLLRAEGDVEHAWRYLSSLPAKIGKVL